MQTVGAVMLLALFASSAQAAPAHDKAGLQREVAAAAAARDWCRALHYTELLETLGHEPRLVFNAAELARAAGDLATARSFYQALIDRDPGYAKAPLARQAIGEVDAHIEANGPGARCAVPPPRCGDGAVEGKEVCDDGNTEGGDACSADCRHAPRCGDNHLDANETCEDGNNLDGDGCSSACLPEAEGTPRPGPERDPAPQEFPPYDQDVVIHEARPPIAVVHDDDAGLGGAEKAGAPGSAVLGMSVIGGGVVVTVTGAVCALVGPVPLLGYLVHSATLDAATEGAQDAPNADAFALEVSSSRGRERDLRVSMEQWNGTGRLITGVGLGLTLLGAGGIILGSVLYRGEEPGEAGQASSEAMP